MLCLHMGRVIFFKYFFEVPVFKKKGSYCVLCVSCWILSGFTPFFIALRVLIFNDGLVIHHPKLKSGLYLNLARLYQLGFPQAAWRVVHYMLLNI